MKKIFKTSRKKPRKEDSVKNMTDIYIVLFIVKLLTDIYIQCAIDIDQKTLFLSQNSKSHFNPTLGMKCITYYTVSKNQLRFGLISKAILCLE